VKDEPILDFGLRIADWGGRNYERESNFFGATVR